MRIFISMAAYRDPELGPSVEHALSQAAFPEALVFGVCWQHGPEEELPDVLRHPRARVADVPWQESRGACWARSRVMDLYNGEEFFLQLDSHHRFMPGWDRELLAMMDACGSPRPVLTTYAPGYTPGQPLPADPAPTIMRMDRFTREGIILFRAAGFPAGHNRGRPAPARFASGHFLFAPGSIVEDVPYDPELYFTGEEITYAVRAFTHGYDLFHPHRAVLFHEYSRAYRPHKHWSDHDGKRTDQPWHQRDVRSRGKVADFLAAPTVGRFGLGTARTFQDYERYAGVSFRHRRAQEYTRRGWEPPNPPAPEGWDTAVEEFAVDAWVDRAALGENAAAARFWFLGLHDADGQDLARHDIPPEEIASLLAQDGPALRIGRTVRSDREPAEWTAWPHHGDGWGNKVTGFTVPRDDGTPCTFVTSLLDIGRASLEPPFQRDFASHYLPAFTRLLRIPAPLCVFASPDLEPLVWKHRDRANTRVIPVAPAALEGFPFFDQVQAIRLRAEWRNQAAWLAASPQAQLPLYNPLVMSKPLWLDAVAAQNPFRSRAFYWLDGGLARTVDERLLLDPLLPPRLAAHSHGFTCVAFPYPDGAEIHGFPRDELRRRAGCHDVPRVVRGGVMGGTPEAIRAAVTRYRGLLESTLLDGFMGTEESVLTLMFHQDPSLAQCFEVAADGLVAPFFEAVLRGSLEDLRVRGDGVRSVAAERTPNRPATPRTVRTALPAKPDVAVYLQTFNAPEQARRWFHHAKRGLPEVFQQRVRIMIDNSTDASTRPAYDALAAEHGFTVVRKGNLGITGGRLFAAEHFDAESGADVTVFFEDDMLTNAAEGVCRNGFPARVERLWERSLAILRAEPDLDFLKLSFTEFHGDHRHNWAWFNISPDEQARFFPRGRDLRVDAVRVVEGLPYVTGDAYYCNWPMLLTRRGNRVVLLEEPSLRHESALMARSLRLDRAGVIRSGVLLASPILHDRVVHYPASERREA